MLVSIYNHASSMWSFDANPGLPQAFPVRPPILPKVGKTGRFPEPRVQREVGNISPRIETRWRVVTSGPPMSLAKFAKPVWRSSALSHGYCEHHGASSLVSRRVAFPTESLDASGPPSPPLLEAGNPSGARALSAWLHHAGAAHHYRLEGGPEAHEEGYEQLRRPLLVKPRHHFVCTGADGSRPYWIT